MKRRSFLKWLIGLIPVGLASTALAETKDHIFFAYREDLGAAKQLQLKNWLEGYGLSMPTARFYRAATGNYWRINAVWAKHWQGVFTPAKLQQLKDVIASTDKLKAERAASLSELQTKYGLHGVE